MKILLLVKFIRFDFLLLDLSKFGMGLLMNFIFQCCCSILTGYNQLGNFSRDIELNLQSKI